MADKRGKDYNKRLNYDELKDKITKEKVPINAPYRTATVIRNSNQMQNLLNMNNLEMEEHNVKLQKEQMKQAATKDLLNGNGTSSEEYQSMTNSPEVERTHDDLQTMYEDSFELLEQSQKEQKESAIKQNKEELGKTGNLGSKLANVALTSTKQLVQIGAAAAATAAGANPAVAAVAHQATGSILQAGYEGVTGGSSSSGDFTEFVTTTPSKVKPGDEIGATPERDFEKEKASIQQKAQKTDIDTIIKIMKKAYKNNQLNDTQTKNWERITKESEGMANTDQSGRAVIERVIRQEYMVYLSYQQGTFKTRSPSRPRGRSVTRREKTPETTHPRSKSRAKSESGYDGYGIVQLKEIAKQKKIKNYSTMRKQELIDALKSV